MTEELIAPLAHNIDAHGPRMLWEGVGVGFQHWPGITVEEWVWFVGSAATCAAIFTFLQQYNKQFRMSVEQQSRVISTIHAIVATVGAIINIMDAWKHMFVPDLFMWFYAPKYARRLIALSSGYLYFDTFIVAYLWQEGFPDPLMLAHHIVILTGNLLGLATAYGGGYISALLLNEASTPFLNVHLGMKPHGILRVVNAFLLWLSFLVSRVLFNAFLTYSITHTLCDDVWRHEGSQTILQLSFFAMLQVLNVRWFSAITRGILEALTTTTAEVSTVITPASKAARNNSTRGPPKHLQALQTSSPPNAGTSNVQHPPKEPSSTRHRAARKRAASPRFVTVAHFDSTVTTSATRVQSPSATALRRSPRFTSGVMPLISADSGDKIFTFDDVGGTRRRAHVKR